MTESNYQELIAQALGALEDGQLQQAYDLLEYARTQAVDDSAGQHYVEIIDHRLDEVRRKAGQEAGEAAELLKEILKVPAEVFDEEAAEAALQRLRSAQLDGEALSQEAQELAKVLDNKRSQVQDVRLVREITEQVEAYWAEAERAEAQGSSDDFIIDTYYKPAEDLASVQAAEHDHLSALKNLARRAQQLRADKALAAEVYLSALQAGQFKEALDNLWGRDDDEQVPRRNVQGDFKGYVTVAEAREELQQLGQAAAASKLDEYLTRVYQLLGDEKPKAALEALGKWENFDIFLRDDPESMERIREAENEINHQIRLLNQAEVLAQEAVELLDTPVETRADKENNTLAAWAHYLRAVEIYASAPEVQDLRRRLVGEMRRLLSDWLKDAQHAWQRRKIDEVFQIERHTQQSYQDKDSSLDVLLAQIDRVASDARQFREDVQNAQMALVSIQDLARRDPQLAYQQLTELTYTQDVLDAITSPAYEAIRTQLLEGIDTQHRLAYLKEALTSSAIGEVEHAIQVAKDATKADSSDSRLFAGVCQELELHLVFLLAQRDYNLNNYQAALEGMKQVAAVDHIDQEEAKQLVNVLENLVTENAVTQDRLNHIQEMLPDDPAAAWRSLTDQEEPVSNAQKQLWMNLKRQARTMWMQQINQDMRAWQQTDMLPIEQVEAALSALRRELGESQRYEEWSQIMGPLITIQEARDLASQNEEAHLRQAIDKWQEVLNKNISRDQRRTVQDELLDARKRLGRLLWAKAQRIATQISVRSYQDDLEAITIIQTQLAQMVERYPDDVQLMLWLAEISGIMAQVSRNHEERREHFEHMENQVAQAYQRMQEYSAYSDELQADIQQLRSVAQKGKDITESMRRIDTLLRPERSVSDFIQACKIWQTLIEPYVEEFTFLEGWWRNQRERVLNALAQQAGQAEQPIELTHVRPLIKILVLEPDNTRGQQMLKDMPQLENDLYQAVELLEKNLETAQEIPGRTPGDRLAYQLEQASTNLDVAESIDKALEQFGPTMQEESNRLNTTRQDVKQLIDRLRHLNVTLDKLDKLRQEVEAAMPGEIHQEQMRATDNALLQMRREFSKHPIYRNLLERREEAIETRRQLHQARDELARLIAAEDYNEALRQVQEIQIDLWKKYKLYYTFTVQDPATGKLFEGVESIRSFVEQKQQYLERIFSWAEPFDIQESGLTNQPSVLHVVDWPDEFTKVKATLDKGAFDDARVHVKSARFGPTIHPGRILSLMEAKERIETPPAASKGTDAVGQLVDDRYRDAIEHAGTEKGRELLRWIQQERLPMYVQHLRETQETEALIQETEHRWRVAFWQWEQGVQQLAQEMRKIDKRNPNKAQKNSLRQILEKIYSHYQQCRVCCPDNVLLRNMIDDRNAGGLTNWLYKKAIKLTGYDPARSQ